MSKDNRSGYTVIELIMVISFSLSILIALHYIPIRITESFSSYSTEVATNRDVYRITSSIYADLEKSNSIEGSSNGFKIGDSQYIFLREGLYRTHNHQTLLLSEEDLDYEINENTLKITDKNAENKKNLNHTSLELIFPLQYMTRRIEGGL